MGILIKTLFLKDFIGTSKNVGKKDWTGVHELTEKFINSAQWSIELHLLFGNVFIQETKRDKHIRTTTTHASRSETLCCL